jgi:hypothetical protein
MKFPNTKLYKNPSSGPIQTDWQRTGKRGKDNRLFSPIWKGIKNVFSSTLKRRGWLVTTPISQPGSDWPTS